METLELLSNLTSLTMLSVGGRDLRSEGLWHLLTMGQLSVLDIYGSPKFFVDCFPHQDEQELLLLSRSSKLHKLVTRDIEGFLRAPVCKVLSLSLTILRFLWGEIEGFTKEQAEALHLFTSLQELEFWWCRELRSLPEGLNKLTNLKTLRIYNCPAIGCLPKNGLPSSLQILDVSGCKNEELKEQCRQLRGTIPEIKT
jgi:Leucine-rich repeat (LRR) protein